jgi:protoheme ferro-lyase
MEYRKIAEDLGINDFRMSKALECHAGFITALADSVEKTLQTPMDSNLEKQKNQISAVV